MGANKILIGSAIALLLGYVAYKVVEKYLEVDDLDFGFADDEVVGM